MKNSTFLALSLLVVSAMPAFAGPEDIVPRQHPVYDVLAVTDPALWRGDVQLTRREVKERLEKLTRTDDLVQTMRREFGAAVTDKSNTLAVSGQFQVRTGTPSRGSVSAGYGQAVVQLQGGYRRTAVESAYAVIPWRVLDITVGKKPLRWGPGFTGGLLVGDQATSIPHLSVEKSFSVGRQLGRWRFTQFYGQSFEDDVPSAPATSRGTRRHIGGRRLETDGDGPWNLALSESYKATRQPAPFFSQTLPYYVYQNDWTATSKDRWLPFSSAGARQPDSFWFNYQFDVAVSYRDPQSGITGYADYLLDDIKAPEGLGRDGRVPPRTGRLFGVRIPSKNLDTRLEYAKLDALTYYNASPPLSWERGGQPLGYSYGGNVRALFARFDAKVSDRDGFAVELRSARPITTTPEQPAPVPEKDERITFFAHRKLNQNQLLGLKLEAARGRATRADLFFGTAW